MIKRWLSLPLLTLVAIGWLFISPAQGADTVQVELNYLTVEFDTPAVIHNDRVMVPFRG